MLIVVPSVGTRPNIDDGLTEFDVLPSGGEPRGALSVDEVEQVEGRI
jgi:hypothetical protein